MTQPLSLSSFLVVFLSCLTGIANGSLLETHDSLQNPPTNGVELATGTYASHLLDRPLPYRVFSPAKPTWERFEGQDIYSEGMRLVVYVMNLKGVARPSKASDREIIEGLIGQNMLVVAVDFEGGEMKTALEFQRDINGLFLKFGGQWHGQQGYYTKNRAALLNYPGPNEGGSILAFKKDGVKIPINRGAIYVAPSGYTVTAHVVVKEGTYGKGDDPTERGIFFDLVHPKKAEGNTPVPLLLEGSSTGFGNFVVNANTPILYSWLFHGYAFASMNWVPMKDDDKAHAQVHAVRYLRTHLEQFSLSGKIGTAGISKSCHRCHHESDLPADTPTSADGKPYGKASHRVDVCMPAVGHYDGGTWRRITEDSPGLIISWCRLNNKHDKGGHHRAIEAYYKKKGLSEKCHYIDSPKAGHEYDLYNLDTLLRLFDQYCKVPLEEISR